MAGRATTSTLTAVLVDDEPLACDELAYLLREYPDLEVVATGANGLQALDLIQKHEPDLVFLDVHMPGLDGIGLIRQLRERNLPLPHFVLVTAYEQYAVEAFELEALDYLLKPIDHERLALTLERARRAIQAKSKDEVPRESAALQRSKLLVRTAGRNFVVDARDLVYATIQDGLITVVTGALEGQSNYHTLEDLQSNLNPDQFWRVHRSYLVNIHRIKEVIPWFKSSYQLRMDDKKQTEIPVSRVQTKRLRTMLKL